MEVKGNEIENKNKKIDESIVKITITKTAGAALAKIIDRVNNGFDGKKVHRQDVASWIIEDFFNTYDDVKIQHIRQANYDPTDMLEVVYRKMKETGEIPDFLKDALQKQFQNICPAPKKIKKNLKNNSINDGVERYEEST